MIYFEWYCRCKNDSMDSKYRLYFEMKDRMDESLYSTIYFISPNRNKRNELILKCMKMLVNLAVPRFLPTPKSAKYEEKLLKGYKIWHIMYMCKMFCDVLKGSFGLLSAFWLLILTGFPTQEMGSQPWKSDQHHSLIQHFWPQEVKVTRLNWLEVANLFTLKSQLNFKYFS